MAIMVALGVWQLHRLTWKLAIIAQIRTAQAAPPIALPEHPTPFEKVQLIGTWVPAKAALYGDEVQDSPTGPIPGAELIMPLTTQGGVILVDLGWVPQQSPHALRLPATPVGYVRIAEHPGWFSAPDDPAHGLFYTLNPAPIAQSLGLRAAPYMLIALGSAPAPGSGLPIPAQDLPTPPNNHNQYALTWFSLAATLGFQFIFFARKRLLAP